MIDMNELRANPDRFRAAARNKRIPADIDGVLELDRKKRELQQRVEELRGRRKQFARAGGGDDVRVEARALGEELAGEEEKLRTLAAEFERAVLFVPSIPADDVPVGQDEDANVEVRRIGNLPAFDFEPRDHIELARLHGLAEFDAARTFAGARAYALMGKAVLLEQALLRFALDFLVTARGFTAVAPPLMVRANAMVGTGYFPVGVEDAYVLERDDLYLAGTAEVPLAALQMDRVFDAGELPLRLAGVSTCFRREAGGAGRDTRGLYRVHQFQKVEQVVFCENDPDTVRAMHAQLLANAETLVQALELPYRVMALCTAELGLGQIRKHDIETWMPSRGNYGETHSCSTLGDFQARRLNTRYRAADGKKLFCATLNNTAIASPRILIPLLEVHQRANGAIHIPLALRPYLNGAAEL